MNFFEYLRLPKEMRIDILLEHGECEYDDIEGSLYSLYDFWVITKQTKDGDIYYLRACRERPHEFE